MASRLACISVKAASGPTTRSSAATGAAKPAETMPPLRPEAPAPTVRASSSTAGRPRSARDRAVASPASPPPTMPISASSVPSSGGRGAGAGAWAW
jgi:hypothetical protein